MVRRQRGLRGLKIVVTVLGVVCASACGSMVHVATERESAVGTAAGDPLAVDLRLRADALEISLTNRGETPIDVLWDKTSLVDTEGNASGVVHSAAAGNWAAADRSGDVSRIPPHATLDGFIIPSRSVTLDPDYGWVVLPLLPVECGPVRCIGYHELVGKSVRLRLTVEVEGTERVLDSSLRITQAVRSSRGTRPDDPNLH